MTDIIYIIINSISIIILFFILYLFFIQNDTYLDTNNWLMILNKGKYEKKGSINGIEVRVLEPPHILAGQKGVFATKKFKKCDVIGEYTGIVKKDQDVNINNLYLFYLVDDLIVDGEVYSNELKYVNSHLNINNKPNLQSSVCYINKEPKVLYVCLEDINIGEELLIDYGEEYNTAHLYSS